MYRFSCFGESDNHRFWPADNRPDPSQVIGYQVEIEVVYQVHA